MTTNQPERKEGFYWVTWGAAAGWEPAFYKAGRWCMLGSRDRGITPTCIGPEIPAYAPVNSTRRFFCQDQTGHGGSATMNYAHIVKHFDINYKMDPGDDDEYSFGEWLEESQIGDQYTYDDEQCTFIRVEDEKAPNSNAAVVPAGSG